MGDFFANLRSGVEFPQVVMNQGPLPGSGGLPRPLHDTADGRYNYNSTLLGNITPYAYGEPGYLSSQTAYLNIPHKIQKIVPVVYLPEAKPGATDFFDLSHPVDDGDLAFTLRLDRNSLFCTGLKNGNMRRAGLGNAIDPLINLATVNYILSGVQCGIPTTPSVGGGDGGNLWTELLFNLDRTRFGKRMGMNSRDYYENPLSLSDIVHIVRHCIRPFGIARGSEKQGGQNEATLSPATWPVSFVVSVTIDGKESNVMNLWHNSNLSAGNDLVLALKLMPLRRYTLNHYYKAVKHQTWLFPGTDLRGERYVWQLVPTIGNIEGPSVEVQTMMKKRLDSIDPNFRNLVPYPGKPRGGSGAVCVTVDERFPWQDLGYWHIGRSQIMTASYGVEEYWHNDLANSLRTNHLDITLQPFFTLPPPIKGNGRPKPVISGSCYDCFIRGAGDQFAASSWKPTLGLEFLSGTDRNVRSRITGLEPLSSSFSEPAPVRVDITSHDNDDDGGGWEAGLGLGALLTTGADRVSPKESAYDSLDIGALEFVCDQEVVPASGTSSGSRPMSAEPPSGIATDSAKRGKRRVGTGAGGGGKAVVGGSILKADGTTEASMVGML